MSALKRSVGIDISKASFTACICSRDEHGSLHFSAVGSFSNEKAGFSQFVNWVRKSGNNLKGVNFLMEATGVYHERLAYYLDKIHLEVNVILPNKSVHYFRSLNVKTKTDEVDARILSQLAIERSHRRWQAPDPVYLHLRHLTRYYLQLQEQKTAFGNLQHSKQEAAATDDFILEMNNRLLQQFEESIHQVRQQIEQTCKSNPGLWEKISRLMTIKGVGLLTVAIIVAETMGFDQIQNAPQLTSYAGYDVVERQSGSSVKGKTRISRKGNRYIRHALYFPAMVCCRFNPVFTATYLRINQNKPAKMIGLVAIQRKLLLLMYTLWKNNTTYDPNYKKVAPATTAGATQDSARTSFDFRS